MKKKTVKKVPVKSPKNPQIAAITEAAREVIERFKAGEDIRAAVAKLEHVITRGRGRVSDESRIDLIRHYSGQGWTVRQIVDETKIPESTVRKYYGRPE